MGFRIDYIPKFTVLLKKDLYQENNPYFDEYLPECQNNCRFIFYEKIKTYEYFFNDDWVLESCSKLFDNKIIFIGSIIYLERHLQYEKTLTKEIRVGDGQLTITQLMDLILNVEKTEREKYHNIKTNFNFGEAVVVNKNKLILTWYNK